MQESIEKIGKRGRRVRRGGGGWRAHGGGDTPAQGVNASHRNRTVATVTLQKSLTFI